MDTKKLLAEFLGAMALLVAGVGAIASNHLSDGGSGLVGIALAHGLAITLMATAVGGISGGHFNPAVSFAFAVSGKMSWKDMLFYWVAQLLGATAGTALALVFFGSDTLSAVAYGIPALGDGVSAISGMLAEILATAFLMFVIVTVAVQQNHVLATLLIGLTIVMDILFMGSISGAAMNPARAFGPALLSGNWGEQWIYWIAPILGATIGIFAANFLAAKTEASS